jgi:cyclopropane-fatty-acyl-phospholipid synthase
MCKYIFPGGELPYASELLTSAKNLFVVEDLHSFGKSYKKTLAVWYKNFNDNWKGELEKKYDKEVEGRFFRMWNFYLQFCMGGFECRAIQLMQVVYTKIGRKTEYKSVRCE